MRIKVMSDVHLEKLTEYPNIYTYIQRPVDIICLCGDIGDPRSNDYKRFLLDCAEICTQMVYVILGNHEFHGSTIEATRKVLENICGCHERLKLLDNTVHVLGDVTFIGTTLWSEIDTTNDAMIKSVIKDYTLISGWTIPRCIQTHEENKCWLRKVLDDCTTTKAIVMTHHVPSLDITHPKHTKSILTSAYASNINRIIIEHSDKIVYWLYGHNHWSAQHDIVGVKIISNQVSSGNYDPFLILEL